jgi:hypothetical protein
LKRQGILIIIITSYRHNFYVSHEYHMPPTFARHEYAVAYLHLTYPTATDPKLVTNVPAALHGLLQADPACFSFQTIDLVVRLSDWTALLERIWLCPTQVTAEDRAALAGERVIRIAEDCLYCLEIMRSSSGNTSTLNLEPQSNAAKLRTTESKSPRPRSPYNTTTPSSDGLLDEAGGVSSSKPAEHIEYFLVLALFLYSLNCFYTPGSKGFKMYQASLKEVTALLQSTFLLFRARHDANTSRSTMYGRSRDAGLGGITTDATFDILVWCAFVAAEGWRNAQGKLAQPGQLIIREAVQIASARHLLAYDTEPDQFLPEIDQDKEVTWREIDQILARGLYCGPRVQEWKLCWDEYVRWNAS